MNIKKYSIFLICFSTIRIQAGPTDTPPDISVYNATHAIISYENSFTQDILENPRHIKLIFKEGEYEKDVTGVNMVPFDVCREHLVLELEIDGEMSGQFKFYPIDYKQLILDNTCITEGLVLIDVEQMIRSNDTFAYCHKWIKVLDADETQTERTIEKQNDKINVTVSDFNIQYLQRSPKAETENGEKEWWVDVEKSSLKPCPRPGTEDSRKQTEDNIALYAGLGCAAVLVIIIVV